MLSDSQLLLMPKTVIYTFVGATKVQLSHAGILRLRTSIVAATVQRSS
jgi:hypothetical protein